MFTSVRHAIGARLGRPRRWRYLERLPKDGIGAEIGVYRGDFTPDLIRVTEARHVHLIDPWWTLRESYDEQWFETSDTREAYELAQLRLAGQPVTFHVADDRDVLPTFPDHYFDWVYLDSSHRYDDTVEELELLRMKLKPSGVLAGHDWFEDPTHGQYGVVPAVREFCERHGWQLGPLDTIFDQWSIWPPDHGDTPSGPPAA
jgi:hypothetical protein